MFWKIMKPKGGGDPTGPIAQAITKTFGNFKDFQTKFNDAGVKQFGSGWVWLASKGGDDLTSFHAQPGQPHLRRPLPNLRQRRLGARLLPEIQQPPSGISGRLVERNQLGRSKRPLRSLQERQVSPGTSPGRR